MSSNNGNNDNAGIILVFSVIGAIAYLAFLAVFFLMMFGAFVLTFICFFAWNKLLMLGNHPLMPEEARAFVKRGLAGAALVPAFFVFVALFLGVPLNGDALFYGMVGGYTLGSIGLELLWAHEAQQVAAQAPPIQPYYQINPPQSAPPPSLPAPPRPPFHFASWDDEDGR